jgi:hypothetical protein
MRRFLLIGLFVFCGLGVVGTREVAAQGRRYSSPSRPTLPSQLNYFRGDTGLLDPYNTFVQPQNQLQNRLRSMETQQQETRSEIQKQQSQESAVASKAAPTGTAATYQNLSHYYPSTNRAGAARGRTRRN